MNKKAFVESNVKNGERRNKKGERENRRISLEEKRRNGK